MDAVQPLTPKVEPLRAEFAGWLQTIPANPRARSRSSHCVVRRDAKMLQLCRCSCGACCERLLPIAGDAGVAIVKKVATGKPIDRLTLGQQVQLLEALDTTISRKLRERLPKSRTLAGTWQRWRYYAECAFAYAE